MCVFVQTIYWVGNILSDVYREENGIQGSSYSVTLSIVACSGLAHDIPMDIKKVLYDDDLNILIKDDCIKKMIDKIQSAIEKINREVQMRGGTPQQRKHWTLLYILYTEKIPRRSNTARETDY